MFVSLTHDSDHGLMSLFRLCLAPRQPMLSVQFDVDANSMPGKQRSRKPT